ncbi:MAG: hypothetical protein WCF26_05310 [Candidatus Sulfotelmatobacter sp.]
MVDPHYEKLLETWKPRGRCFIEDGIIDDDRWHSADPKVLLLLKEARHEGTGTWDLRRHLREEDPTNTWQKSAYWCYAVQGVKSGSLRCLPFSNMPERKAEYEKAVEALRASAIVNIKKIDGKETSDNEDIRKHAERNRHLIKQQIELIKPDLVICGNTWRFVENWWDKKEIEKIYDGVYRVGQHQRVFIDFWHPAYRISEDLKYYALAAMVHFSHALAKRALPVAA